MGYLRPRLPFSPVLASLIGLVVVWVWHAPALQRLAAGSAWLMALEPALFLAAGLLLWLTCFGKGGRRTEARRAAGAFALLLTSAHMTLLALAPRPFHGEGEVNGLGLILTAGQDQELAGVLMLLVGAGANPVGGIVLLGRLLSANGPSREA